jgi:uncharacterized protein (DUF58 family)
LSPAVGALVDRQGGRGTLAHARDRAAQFPDLLVEARRIAASVFGGWHGRRKRGAGEDFWQFRPYVAGENLAAVDWRRSARDEHVYLRDREWQAAHTVWLWVDESPSMLFASRHAAVSKQGRALLLVLALAELLARSGERVGLFGLTAPILNRNAAGRIAERLSQSPPQTAFPRHGGERGYFDLVAVSDFLAGGEALRASLAGFARAGARVHLIHVHDPAERLFPYAGRVEFTDPETGARLTAGNAATLQAEYARAFARHVDEVRRAAAAFRYGHVLHATDRPATQALAALHMRLAEAPAEADR